MKIEFLLKHTATQKCLSSESCILLSSQTSIILLNCPFVAIPCDDHLRLCIPQGMTADDSPLYTVDAIVISEPSGLLALPLLMRNWAGKVYATEAAKEFGQLLLENWVSTSEDFPCKNVIFDDGVNKTEVVAFSEFYSRKEMKECLDQVQTVRYGEYIFVNESVTARPYCSGFSSGSSNWLISIDHCNVFFVGNSSSILGRLNDPMTLSDLPPISICIHHGRISAVNYQYTTEIEKLCQQIVHSLKSNKNCLLCVPPSFLFFDLLNTFFAFDKKLGIHKIPICAYMDISSFVRRLPILSEWFYDTSWTNLLTIVQPGAVNDVTKMITLTRKTPVLTIVSSADVLVGNHFSNLIQLMDEYSNPISSVFIADTSRNSVFLENIITRELPSASIAKSDLDPCLNFKDLEQAMSFPGLQPATHIIPDFMALKMIGPTMMALLDKTFKLLLLSCDGSGNDDQGVEISVDGRVLASLGYVDKKKLSLAPVTNAKLLVSRRVNPYQKATVKIRQVSSYELVGTHWLEKVKTQLNNKGQKYTVNPSTGSIEVPGGVKIRGIDEHTLEIECPNHLQISHMYSMLQGS